MSLVRQRQNSTRITNNKITRILKHKLNDEFLDLILWYSIAYWIFVVSPPFSLETIRR